jgi:hypothetical protein
MEVLLLNNPLKQIICTGKYTLEVAYANPILKSPRQEKEESKHYIKLVKEYMDLSKGVWNVTADTYVYRINKPNSSSGYDADLTLDVSTNLVTGYSVDNETNTHQSRPVCLGQFSATSTAASWRGSFEKKWFTVDTGREFFNFELYVQKNQLAVYGPLYDIDFEISFLFQRIK